MEVSDVIESAAEILQDTDHITYTEEQLIRGLNKACLATVLVRPDASSDIMLATLNAGVGQYLPGGALRLMDVYYRLDENDEPIPINLADRQELDLMPTDGPVQHVSYSEKLPTKFLVSPPAKGGEKLVLLCSHAPIPITALTDDFPLTDKYAEPVREYLLYLMFSRDAERSPNATRAQAHRQAFFDLLQIKMTNDAPASAETKRMSGM